MTSTFIHITNQEQLDLNVKDCKKLQKQIEKLQEKMNKTIKNYNNIAFSIKMVTSEYENILPEYK